MGGGGNRSKVAPTIYEHNASSVPTRRVHEHWEMSYSTVWPKYLAFTCLKSCTPGYGHATVSSVSPTEMDPNLYEKLLKQGVCVQRHMLSGNGEDVPYYASWQSVFGTNDKKEVEIRCREQHMSYSWDGDSLNCRTYLPAFLANDGTGHGQASGSSPENPLFFNHVFNSNVRLFDPDWKDYYGGHVPVNKRPFSVLYGNSEADCNSLQEAEIRGLQEVIERNRKLVEYTEGDILIIDNEKVCHGRSPYPKEDERRLCLAFGTPRTRADPFQKHGISTIK